MKQLALIGKHLSHSFSKEYYTRFFEQHHIDAQYRLCELECIEDFESLKASQTWYGFNVTIPYKVSIIPYLDHMHSSAQACGAVNTIAVKDGLYTGYNTDLIGFKSTLMPLLMPQHQRALVLGTGGASKAVQAALRQLNIPYTLVSRSKTDNTIGYADLTHSIITNHTIIINTTPLGMYPNIDEAPDIPYHAITPQHLCYDIIYNPDTTLFLQHCASRGAHIQNGLAMLYAQADAAIQIWFGT